MSPQKKKAKGFCLLRGDFDEDPESLTGNGVANARLDMVNGNCALSYPVFASFLLDKKQNIFTFL